MAEGKPFFTVLRGAHILAPEDLGCQDVLVAGDKIAAIGPRLDVPTTWECQEVQLDGCSLTPGFIDGHVHMIGGGGEGGYSTRTPEVNLSAVTKAGVTTVIGCLGTDGTTRHMASLLAKARGLECEGISTYIYTGAYEVPTRTLTGSVRTDLIIIDKVIGTGEIAISDHRSAQPLQSDIQKLAAEARVGGMLSGKAGVMNLHVGDGKSGLDMLFAIAEESEIPITQFVPTHLNRNPWLFKQAIEWGKRGGFIDITSGVNPASGAVHAIKPSRAIHEVLAAGVELSRITMSSDGNGSMPHFDEKGNMVGLMVASEDSLLAELHDLVCTEGLPLAQAIQVVTSNVARTLKLWPRKGSIQVGADADFVVLTPDLALKQVWARGRLMVDEGEPVVWGTFEKWLG
ncbi:MAG TPA: beta-aspartyl-peptidase [Firmicutes bacterium]|nr:beta-aspartyl-peptidase [Bacillota bacterium]